MTARRLRIGLVAGETSGDQLGAGLMQALRARFPDAEFAGIGGDNMRAAGFDAWHDASELAVFGLAEVLAHLPRLLRVRRALRERMLAWKPDVFVGIDAPDFNLGVEKWLKQRGIRTVHDVSPSLWAWRQSRAAKIGQSADRVLCLFPMEPPIYAQHGVDARYIGHPLADALPLEPDRNAAREALGIAQDARVLAVLPGSRLGEIHRLAPTFFAAAAQLSATLPDLQILVPAANAACRRAIEAALPAELAHVTVLDGQAQRAMIAGDAVLLASGTAALEAMLCKRPMVVAYRLAPLTHAIVRTFGLLKVQHVSLPNVLAGEALVPELLQDDCTPDKLAAALRPLLCTPEPGLVLQARFRELHLALRRDASARAADAIAELLDAPAPLA
ncbi:lipid-A-disaccharide synthase [Lysobacter sp. 2RAF19]